MRMNFMADMIFMPNASWVNRVVNLVHITKGHELRGPRSLAWVITVLMRKVASFVGGRVGPHRWMPGRIDLAVWAARPKLVVLFLRAIVGVSRIRLPNTERGAKH